MGDLMTIRDVQAAYAVGGREVRAVDGVSLTLREGEVLGIAGESGCGSPPWLKCWPSRRGPLCWSRAARCCWKNRSST